MTPVCGIFSTVNLYFRYFRFVLPISNYCGLILSVMRSLATTTISTSGKYVKHMPSLFEEWKGGEAKKYKVNAFFWLIFTIFKNRHCEPVIKFWCASVVILFWITAFFLKLSCKHASFLYKRHYWHKMVQFFYFKQKKLLTSTTATPLLFFSF